MPDVDRITWADRDVVLLFDTNVATNRSVSAARRALGQELSSRGARVRMLTLPQEPDVNGPDDFVALRLDSAGGDDLSFQLRVFRPGTGTTAKAYAVAVNQFDGVYLAGTNGGNMVVVRLDQ